MIWRKRLARTAFSHFIDQPPILLFIHNRGCGIEPSILEELACGASHDEAMVRVIGSRCLIMVEHLAGRGINLIHPDQLVGISKRVSAEFERTRFRSGTRGGRRATNEEQQGQQDDGESVEALADCVYQACELG